MKKKELTEEQVTDLLAKGFGYLCAAISLAGNTDQNTKSELEKRAQMISKDMKEAVQ